MGIPACPPPPRRDGETLEDYQARCEPWRRATISAAAQSRQSFRRDLVFVVGVLGLCAVVLLARGCPVVAEQVGLLNVEGGDAE